MGTLQSYAPADDTAGKKFRKASLYRFPSYFSVHLLLSLHVSCDLLLAEAALLRSVLVERT
jgi:hypothetical protein